MTLTTPLRRSPAAAGFGRIVLMSFVLATAMLLAPGGAAAEERRGDWAGQPAEPGGGTGAAVTSAVNLRSGPSIESEVLAVVPAGSAVQITGGSQAGFVPVTVYGMSGFVAGDYIGGGGNAQASAPEAQASAAPDQASAPAAAVTNGSLPVVIATDAVVADDAAANPGMVAIIYAAADAYGQSRADMLRVAACESNLIATAVNEAGASYGLFQFIPSTWGSTPYADQDIFDPVANANAAAWMWSVGRRGEWVCQ